MFCPRCKKERPEELKESGESYKWCKECRDKQNCKHNRCKKCKGKGVCKHNKRKGYCKECGGGQICKHKKFKGSCRECDGSQICVHNKHKNSCKKCKPNNFCKHNRHKNNCRECGSNSFCEHGKLRGRCKKCGGKQICIHNRRKPECKDCKGSAICIHIKQKSTCIICTPKNACVECKSICVKTSKYRPMCARCYAYTHPDEKLPRKFKLKENIFFDAIREKYPELKMSIRFDKQIDNGCSGKRPDIFIDCLTHVIIGELDENEHSRYEEICENRRIMELFQDVGNRPVVVLRLNPDSYYKDDEKYNGCFSYTKSGTISVHKKEWEKRMKLFTWHLDSWLTHIPKKEVTIRKFFYSK